MKKSIIAGIILSSGLFMACDDVFVPAPENNLPIDFLEENSTYAENMLGVVYTYYNMVGGIPFNEPATDDAVSNDATNSWRRIAAGSWTSQENPVNRWENCRSAIQYCNIFLDNLERITWTKEDFVNDIFEIRFRSEALALRGIHMYFLLQAHGGYSADGQLLGIPIVLEPEGAGTNFNIPRDSFEACVAAAKSDLNEALKGLPIKYGSTCFQDMRAKYPGITDGQLERLFGEKFTGRIDGRIVEAFIARLDLLSASPAFGNDSGITWADAANSNAKVIERIGGIDGLDPTGNTWYCHTDIDNYSQSQCPPEVMWRSEKGNSHDLEQENFPPSLYGNGRINPTQNFVDAFPMENGYPISSSESGYDPGNPYAGRDPRLGLYVIYNGAPAGINNSPINTGSDSSNDDGLGKISTSTRTGYYLKKHLRMDVNCNPSSVVDKSHYTARLRYTEFFLNFAEAANEAWGPMGSSQQGYSAYEVIKQIRRRAGIGLENGDAYLESIKNDKEAMRELIRNERRIELSFEGFRFFDLRRWKADLNEAAQGVNISNGVYNIFNVESRNYVVPQMYYGPIPYSEVLKFSELKQNAGW
ncbi:MAG: RagB/SusD family nutrient uptake outer membrane protein [Muribaculaceae bacterium]|nr:RagB/SusD family nutrient uptake outer membrane protein [Muribaculaceae bacterium]